MRKLLLAAAFAFPLCGTAMAQDTVKIGYIDPLSGGGASVGEVGLKTYQFLADELNAKGGILGKKVEIVPLDNKTNPQESLIQAQKAIDSGVRYLTQGNGSSVGIAIVTADGNYGSPIGRDVQGPWQEFEELLAEPYVRGRELTTAVLEGADGPRALGVTELRPKSGFYDYDAKYTDGMTEHLFPAPVPDEIAETCMSIALEAHRLLGCKGCSRADFRWDDERGVDGLFLLEVNTQPGMTPLSLVPEQARHTGMSYAELVQAIVDAALREGGA